MGELRNDREARYLELIDAGREESTLEEIFQRMTVAVGGSVEGLPAICASWDVPYGRVLTWLMASEERYRVYLRALEVMAHAEIGEALAIADAEPGRKEDGTIDSGSVGHAKLRVETRFRRAKYHAPAVYAERVAAQENTLVLVDSGLTMKMAELLDRVSGVVTVPAIDVSPEL